MSEHTPFVFIAATDQSGRFQVGVLPGHVADSRERELIYFERAPSMEAALSRKHQLETLAARLAA